MKPKCGKRKTNHGKEWTREGIASHEKVCKWCKLNARKNKRKPVGILRNWGPVDPGDDSISDGAYWSMLRDF